MPTIFQKARAGIISLTLFLFPLFFLPITTEFYATNKQYLLVLCSILLIALGSIEIIAAKKLDRRIRMFDDPVILLIIATGLSILVSSPNKPAAAIAPVTGIVSLAACAVLYFFLSREKHETYLSSYVTILQYAVTVVCIIEIAVYSLSAFGVTLPQNLAFFASPLFSPVGSIVDLVAFLGFFFVYTGIRLVFSIGNREVGAGEVFSFILVSAATALAALTYFSTPRADIPYAPFEYTVKTLPLILKSPVTTIFGYGVDNFSAAFTQAKDSAYLQTAYGAIQSFSFGRSALLHILTEAGILGAFSLLLIFLRGIYESLSLPKEVKIATFGLFVYMFVAFLAFPPSLILLFLLFITLGLLHHDIAAHSHRASHRDGPRLVSIPAALSSMTAVLVIAALGAGGYIFARFYLADVAFRRSARSISNRNLSRTYNDQLSAIRQNPYIEKYRTSFSQTNLYVANRIAAQAQDTKSPLSPADQGTVRNAINTAIEESRAATILNSQKAANWENFGRIYKNLLNVAEGADGFAISAFQRASRLDPYNPVYKNELGEVYYLTEQYKQAAANFAAAVDLKPDYTNARFNLAWSLFRLNQKQEAASQMETVVEQLGKTPDSAQYKQARSDLERFRL